MKRLLILLLAFIAVLFIFVGCNESDGAGYKDKGNTDIVETGDGVDATGEEDNGKTPGQVVSPISNGGDYSGDGY